MKSRVFWIATLALAGLLAGGCVPVEQLREAENANRVLQDEKQELEAENQRLRDQLGDRAAGLGVLEGRLEDKDQRIAYLQEEIDLLQADKARLARQLQDALEGQAPPALAPLPEELDKALKAFAGQHPDLIEYLPDRGMVKFKSDLTFAKGSVQVGPEAREALKKFATILNQAGNQRFMIFIAGHTDDIPIKKPSTRSKHPTNWYLSVHRALSVQDYLAKVGNVDPERTAAMGFGPHQPIAPNKPNNGGNPLNRRVEIWIVPPGTFLTQRAVAPEDADDK